MKKRWILNLFLLLIIAGLVTFLYWRPQHKVATEKYELTTFKLADFNAISVEFPNKASVDFEKVNGVWRMTQPYKQRADQQLVLRIMSILAATSNDKFPVDTPEKLAKFGLDAPALRIKLTGKTTEVFSFGTFNTVTEQQYVAFQNLAYLLPSVYSEVASTQPIELLDKSPVSRAEAKQIVGFDFSKLEQWQDTGLKLDLSDGQWTVSIPDAKATQNALNEWMDFNWAQAQATSVEIYTPDYRMNYPSLDIKLKDGKKIHFDKMQESPELLLARPDEGLMYHFSNDVGFTMLNPPLSQAGDKSVRNPPVTDKPPK